MREQADEQLGFMEQLTELDFGSTLGEFVQVGLFRSFRQADLDSVDRIWGDHHNENSDVPGADGGDEWTIRTC